MTNKCHKVNDKLKKETFCIKYFTGFYFLFFEVWIEVSLNIRKTFKLYPNIF